MIHKYKSKIHNFTRTKLTTGELWRRTPGKRRSKARRHCREPSSSLCSATTVLWPEADAVLQRRFMTASDDFNGLPSPPLLALPCLMQLEEAHPAAAMGMLATCKVTVSIPMFDLFLQSRLHLNAGSISPITANVWNYSQRGN
jgi:hypothetical protein